MGAVDEQTVRNHIEGQKWDEDVDKFRAGVALSPLQPGTCQAASAALTTFIRNRTLPLAVSGRSVAARSSDGFVPSSWGHESLVTRLLHLAGIVCQRGGLLRGPIRHLPRLEPSFAAWESVALNQPAH